MINHNKPVNDPASMQVVERTEEISEDVGYRLLWQSTVEVRVHQVPTRACMYMFIVKRIFTSINCTCTCTSK